MIIVSHRGEDFCFYWDYIRPDPAKLKQLIADLKGKFSTGVHYGETVCQIKIVKSGERFKDVPVYFRGVAVCNLRDRFNKEQGRKASLTKALKALSSTMTVTKEFRTKVWEKYKVRGADAKTYAMDYAIAEGIMNLLAKKRLEWSPRGDQVVQKWINRIAKSLPA